MPRRSASSSLARGLGARIRVLREEAQITQETLAWDCGFAKGFLSQVEAGKSTPSLAALFALARRLEVDVVDLLAFDSRKPLHQLIDAVRRGDESQVRAQLRCLRLGGPRSVAAERVGTQSGRKARGEQ